MPTLVTLDEAVDKVSKHPSPILFPDTCALLDLIRCTKRDNPSAIKQQLESARNLIRKAANNPPMLWVVVPHPIPDEWDTHKSSAREELKQWKKHIERENLKLHAAAHSLNIQIEDKLVQFAETQFIDSASSLASSFMKYGLTFEDDTCKIAGLNRLRQGVAPAQPGERSPGDCIITEHCLKFVAFLRRREIDEPCVFLTSNTSDYYDDVQKAIREDLRIEFNDYETTPAWSWNMAAHFLGL